MLRTSSAIILEGDVKVKYNVAGVSFSQFRFNDNGHVEFTLTGIDPHKVHGIPYMAVFKRNDWIDRHPCSDPTMKEDALATFNMTVDDIGITMNSSVKDSNTVSALIYCAEHDTTTFSIKAVLMNGDHHLSADDMPQLILYIVVASIWGLFIILWIGNWLLVRYLTKLHVAISVFNFLKLATVLYLVIYWAELDKIGSLGSVVVIGYYIVEIIEMCGFFSVLLLIGAGWGMIDDKPPRKWPVIVGLVVFYGICFTFTLFFTMAAVASIIALVIILYMVYKLAAESTIILQDMVQQLRKTIEESEKKAQNDEDSTSNVPLLKSQMEHCEVQIVMLRRFRIIMMGYVIGRVITSVIVMFSTHAWVESLFAEFLDIALFVCLGIVFRLRWLKKEGMYFLLDNEFDEYHNSSPKTPQFEVESAEDAA